MKIGISTASFFPDFNTEDCFEQVRLAGADVCEVFLESFCEYEEEFIPTLLSKKCVDVHSVHCLTNQFEPQTFSKSERAFEDCKKYFAKVCNIGKNLGANCYTYHGASLLKNVKHNFDFEYIAKRFSALVDIAESLGLSLCYENVHWAYFNSPSFLRELKKYLPNIYTCFDIKQAMQSGICYKEYLKVMQGSIKTVHLCDYDEDGKLLLPRKGIVDFVELFRILKDIGCDAPCFMEVYRSSYDGVDELKTSFEFLQNCLAKATMSI